MYTKAVRKQIINSYACAKGLLANFLRFQYPHDYETPKISSKFPGPNHQEAMQDIQSYNLDNIYSVQLHKYFNDIQLQRFINFKKSKGNFFVDIDGNVILDLHCNYSNLPLGYNHDALINARDSELYDRFLSNKVNTTYLPPDDYADLLRNLVMPVAPVGMNQVHLTDGTTTQANESALMVAMAKYAADHNIQDPSNLCVLGFQNGYHGNSIGTLSCSDQQANIEGVSTFDWPRAPFPEIKYPMAEYDHQNQQEEERCLDEVRKIIKERKEQKMDVAAMIIEPITAINNQMASPLFYKKLRKITKENGVQLVVDETKTGIGSTGKMWGHEHWFLHDKPDIVTFGGKAGISGFYTDVECRTQDYGVQLDQNVDMIKLLNFGVIWKTIQKKNLLEFVNDTSTFMKIELNRIQKERGLISNIRGNGTFLGFDAASPQLTEQLSKYFLRSGIQLLRCGPTTFGMRPSLVLGPKHAATLRDNLLHYHHNFQ